jgi:tetratricopeptide (TPR) repeat protein
MKTRAVLSVCPALVVGILISGCGWVKHVPPGQSLSAAMAKRPELVALPAPPEQALVAVNTGNTAALPSAAPLPAPLPDPQTEKVADAFTLGNLCMQQGRYADAINAYETALKEDPSFAEAWNNLAIAYQNSGQDDKAMAAFRKYKMVALH